MHFPFLAIFLFTNEIATQELTLCPLPKTNSQCVLTCKIPDFKKKISFIWKGNPLGSCELLFNKSVCQTVNNKYLINVNESARETNLTIKSLDKVENEGTWLCEYGNRRSKSKMLQLYDIMHHTSLEPDPIVVEREEFIGIHFQTDCLIPEPTTSLKCKNGEEMCKVSPFEKRKCEKPSLRIFNVTCNTTDECFLEMKSKVEIKVYDIIIEHKVITYNKTDIIYNTSLVSDPIVKETGDFVGIYFQTKCLMPEPTSSIRCKNGVEMCKASTFEKRKCEKLNLRIFNVTCNTTAECFTENESKVEVKVNGTIIAEKVIKYQKRPKEIIEVNNTSHDQISIVVPIIISILVIILVIGFTGFLKYRQKSGKVCMCRKRDTHKSNQNDHQLEKMMERIANRQNE